MIKKILKFRKQPSFSIADFRQNEVSVMEAKKIVNSEPFEEIMAMLDASSPSKDVMLPVGSLTSAGSQLAFMEQGYQLCLSRLREFAIEMQEAETISETYDEMEVN